MRIPTWPAPALPACPQAASAFLLALQTYLQAYSGNSLLDFICSYQRPSFYILVGYP